MAEHRVSKVVHISREFIEEFYHTADAEDRAWIIDRIKVLTEQKGPVYYWPAFRTEFAKRFLPEIISKRTKRQASLLDTLREDR